MAGFKGGYRLADRKTGKGITITLWESEAMERTSQPTAAKVREQAQKALGLQVLSVEAYEVIGQA
jgi:heme-degrading monooxygenase HmoA